MLIFEVNLNTLFTAYNTKGLWTHHVYITLVLVSSPKKSWGLIGVMLPWDPHMVPAPLAPRRPHMVPAQMD